MRPPPTPPAPRHAKPFLDDCLCGLPPTPRHAKPYLDDCLCGLPQPRRPPRYAKPYLDDRYAPRHVTPPQAASSASGSRGSTLTPRRSHADRVHHLSLSRTPVALHVDPGASLVPGVCSCAKQAYEEVLSKQRCLFFEGAQQHPRKKLRKQVLLRATY